MKKGGFDGMFKKAKSGMKQKAMGKMGSMFKNRFGFQNQYDNRILCENLEENEFAQFYIIAFISLVGFLLYKATQKKR